MDNTSRKKPQSIIFGIDILILNSKKKIQNSNMNSR
jgi:hypothetical protein